MTTEVRELETLWRFVQHQEKDIKYLLELVAAIRMHIPGPLYMPPDGGSRPLLGFRRGPLGACVACGEQGEQHTCPPVHV